MPRKKSTDTPEQKALRKLLLSLGLTKPAVNTLLIQMSGRLSDLSAKACEVQLYIATHPDINNPAAYAARTLSNYAAEPTSLFHSPSSLSPDPSPKGMGGERGGEAAGVGVPSSMELWGEESS